MTLKPHVLPAAIACLCLFGKAFIKAESALALTVPAVTAYTEPDVDALRFSKEQGVSGWSDAQQKVLWFGEFKTTGQLQARVQAKAGKEKAWKLKLTVDGQSHEAALNNGVADFGSFEIKKPGYVRLELSQPGKTDGKAVLQSLLLDGPAMKEAHFNVDPRRNAASVHLKYPLPKDEKVTAFYNEVTAVKDPVTTYYMACGFSRGYFGMQVNSPTERRIIFSVWDAASGQNAKDRSTVAEENHTQLVAKGEGVEAHVFGNEGTGGHSHLVYNWKTGEAQKFKVTAEPDGTNTVYTGFWFHPEKKQWMLIASFRAPKDGGYLRGLYSFSENFGGSNGQLQRKALYGPQFIQTADKKGWNELLQASFSHDGTGKEARLDRFMGVENGRFFLSHGGFIEGFTKFGELFTRPASGVMPP